ncbi:MAG: response regulator [Eubacteriales bacterium]|nr:response regulator [Eubacteriales bacterium]
MYDLLVVEDESIIRRGIRAFIDFEGLGIQGFYEAENGEEALDIVKNHHIDLILADINMPRMDGLEFCRLAKELEPSVKIAILTGYDYLDYAIRAIKIGVDDYALKPLDRQDIQKLLFRLVEKKKETDSFAVVQKAVGKLSLDAGVNEGTDIRTQMSELLDSHLADSGFSLTAMAAELGYSISYLSTLFKKYFGENFRDHLLDLRLERAKILLLSTHMKNYEIAAAVGFEDPNYFSVCFRRKYQMTPKEFKMEAGHEKNI